MITAHCLVKNEENFVYYAIKSVINFVDQIIVFDTGSTDKTVQIIQDLIKEHPGKIIFEEKGVADMKRHTELRQEMLEKTRTDWFMILDGDEVWAERAMKEAVSIIESPSEVTWIMAPFYLCVGDIYHNTRKKAPRNAILGNEEYCFPRFLKITDGFHWQGDYGQDTLRAGNGEIFCRKDNSAILKSKYWHMTQLERSPQDEYDYSSGGSRKKRRRLTYFIIGKKIKEPVPEVFAGKESEFEMSWPVSFTNFFKLLLFKINA